jgi:PKD repeat protein
MRSLPRYVAGSLILVVLVFSLFMSCKDKTNNPVDRSPAIPVSCVIDQVTPDHGQAPLSVTFSATASGGAAPYSYKWVFGDGDSSVDQKPSHTFSTAGQYTVSVTATCSQNGTATVDTVINVSPPAALACSATADSTSGSKPFEVAFSCSPTGGRTPYSYSWTFGDGGTSTLQNPSHTYQSKALGLKAIVVVTDFASTTASDTVSIDVLPASPVLSGPARTGGTFSLYVSFEWPPTMIFPPYDKIHLEEKVGILGSYVEILTAQDTTIELTKPVGTYSYRVKVDYSWGTRLGFHSDYSNVVTVRH